MIPATVVYYNNKVFIGRTDASVLLLFFIVLRVYAERASKNSIILLLLGILYSDETYIADFLYIFFFMIIIR